MKIKDFIDCFKDEPSRYSLVSNTKKDVKRPIPWFVNAAHDCILRGRYHLVPTRNDKNKLYFARFWLTKPNTDDKRPGLLNSGDSTLLHYFASADDDGALHNHPWDWFTTTILEGWYIEATPKQLHNISSCGPTLDEAGCNFTMRKLGDRVLHGSSMHSVSKIRKNTWTLVTTGPHRNDWGFFPPGKPFVPHQEYL